MDTRSRDSCPYKGLEPYFEEDRELFFGRRRDSEIIASNLYASPLTVLYGASGVGKSSVLLAGVVPKLKQDPRAAVVVFREWQAKGFVVALKREVLHALGRIPGPDRKVVVDPKLPLDEFLFQCRSGLRMSLFFVLDQFEEYFLYHPPDPGEKGFEAEFARAVNRRDVDANFLISLRDDGLSKLDRFQGRIPHLLANRLHLNHLGRVDAEEAIRKPLEKYNASRPPGSGEVTVDAALVSIVIEDIKIGGMTLGDGGQGQLESQRPRGAGELRVETPFLQMVLIRLWDEATGPRHGPSDAAIRLDVGLLDRLGGARTIVRTHLDTVMELRLDEEDREVAAQLFWHLVTPSGSKVAHTAGDLAQYAGQPLDRVESVLHRLCSESTRVLRPVAAAPGRDEATKFEIRHDVLASAVLELSRRRKATTEAAAQNREELRKAKEEEHRKLAEAERRRAEQAEAAARRQMKLRRLFQVTATFSILLAGVAVFAAINAYQARELTSRAFAEATKQEKKAGEQMNFAVMQERAAKKNEEKAKAQTKLATSRQLAFRSVLERNKQLDLSLLLAVEALRTGKTFEARNCLLKALQDRPALKTFLHFKEGLVDCVAFSRDGKTIAAAHRDGVVLWDASTRKRLSDVPFAVEARSAEGVAFSPDGKAIAAAYGSSNGTGGGVVLWDVATRKRLSEAPLIVKKGRVRGLAFSPDGKAIAAGYGGEGAGVVLWDVATRERLSDMPLAVKSGYVEGVAFSPDGKAIAAAYGHGNGIGGGIVLIDIATGERLTEKPLDVGEVYVEGVAFSPDGKTIAAAYSSDFVGGGNFRDGGVVLWDVGTRKRLSDEPLAVREGGVRGVAFSPDGKAIAAAYGVSDGGGVVLWDVGTRKRLSDGPLAVREGGVHGVAFSPDGKAIAAAYGDWGSGGVVLSDVAASERLLDGIIAVKEGEVRGVAFSPDGKTIAAAYEGGEGGGTVLLDLAAGKPLSGVPLIVREGSVRGVAFSPDGKAIAAAYPGGVVLSHIAASERLLDGIIAVKEGEVRGVAFSPDGKTIAAAYEGGEGSGVVLRDMAAGGRLWDVPLTVKEGSVRDVAFSPDGKAIAAAYGDWGSGGVVLWDVSTRRRLSDVPFAVNKGSVWGVAFSPDGKTFAAAYGRPIGGTGGGVVLWDVAASERRRDRDLEVEGYVKRVAFSPDGMTIAAAFGDDVGGGGVVLWDAATRERITEKPLAVKEGNIWDVAFSPDGKTFAACGRHGVLIFDVDLQSWQRIAGRIANRNFTRAEWRQYFPDEPYHATFPDLPVPPETPLP